MNNCDVSGILTTYSKQCLLAQNNKKLKELITRAIEDLKEAKKSLSNED